MITVENLKDALLAIGFDYYKSTDTCNKSYLDDSCEIRVSFKNKKIEYPTEKGFVINDNTTTNFDHPENFVVLECVNRLLDKGYRPEHIELEKRWNLGHDAKGGKADICVYNQNRSQMLLIIECKTPGKEHNKAFKQLQQDGGQLFSYWQQERSAQWLSLYASDFNGNNITFDNYIVNCSDDANVKKMAKKNKSVKLFEDAKTVTDLFDVWNETYDKQILPKGVIFGEESSAYQIGIPPLRKKHLSDFKPEDKIVNRFEEILRHNNVSDKENAFNRLVALFICKLVDEIQKSDDDIVEFQYKVGTDTYESLQDRLQRLHKEGMEKFMGEEIYYVADDYAEKLFANNLNGKKRTAAIEDLRNTIRILKFYSNNDFAFKDVHNEQLFFQNGKILVEVVQLFERYRIVYPSKHQFLGDLFEQLLNKGFKQNEGQFFTPTPITRFIWDSLPLEKIISQPSGFVFPKIIDYACGAGHFLTEGVEAINNFFASKGKSKDVEGNSWVKKSIYGIEKDYRLARVARVSLYMNGAGEGNVKFGDGLEQYPSDGIENGKFEILVANPPYSVSGFKQHLDLKNNSFELMNCISSDSGEIEILFVERTAQLLKPQGIAAIILPASILTNDDYAKARENILENFRIRCIVQLGNKTFGATGTNTVILFLDKYNEPPKRKEIVKDGVAAILDGTISEDWEDYEIFRQYTVKINVNQDDYEKFSLEELSFDDFERIEYFKQYFNLFQLKIFKNKGNQVKEFYKWIKPIERAKLKIFSLVYSQTTLVITAPSDNNEQKKFLGYDWSNRKGNEGIQINQPGGLLYNDNDRYDSKTLASAIRHSFYDKQISLSEELSRYYSYIRTQDMFDFSRIEFKAGIKASIDRKIETKSKYPLTKLADIAELKKGQTITEAETTPGNIKVVAGGINYAYKHNKANRPAGTITVSASGANAGFVNYWSEPIFASDCTTIIGKNELQTKYIYNYLKTIQDQIYYLQKGAGQPHVYLDDLCLIPIPQIESNIQKSIVNECAKLDDQCKQAQKRIEDCKKKIQNIIANTKGHNLKMSDICEDILAGGDKPKDFSEFNTPETPIPVFANGIENNGLIGYTAETRVTKPSISISARGSIGFTCIHKEPFFPIVRLVVAIPHNNIIDIKYFKYALDALNIGNTGSVIPQLTIPNFSNCYLKVPSFVDQQKIVKQIEEQEQIIVQAKAILENSPVQKQAILKKYLE